MYDRFSISKKRFLFLKRKITLEEFVKFSKQFCETFTSTCLGGSVVSIALYKSIPTYETTGHPEIQKMLSQDNERLKIVTLHDLNELTKKLFSLAAFIELRIEPKDKEEVPSVACGWVSCKGLLSDHILFYSQPEKYAVPIWMSITTRLLSDPRYNIGDGFENNTFLFTVTSGCVVYWSWTPLWN